MIRNRHYWPEMRRQDLEEARDRESVVVVPVGSIEQHGPHCPVDVDLSIPTAIAQESALRAEGAIVVGQPIPFGFTHYNRGFVGTITLQLDTFLALVRDVARSVHDNGFERIVLLNGHGGNHNPLKSAAAALAEHDIYVLALSHWDLVANELRDLGAADTSIGHAGEWETSYQLHLRPELVDFEKAVSEEWESSVGAAFEAMVRFPERQRETPHGVMGNAMVASAEKGSQIFDKAVERLVELTAAYRAQPVRRYRHFQQRARSDDSV
ncbi:MAG: creatininase family protein [Trueperaceae bacterium]